MTRDEQLIRAALEMAAETCLRMGSQWWATYKDRHSPHVGDSRYEGMSDGADEIHTAIRAIDPAEVLAKVGAVSAVTTQPSPDAVARLREALRNMTDFALSKMDDPSRADEMRLFIEVRAALAAMENNK